MQRGCVIDPVADVAHHVARVFQGQDDPVLLIGFDFREHVDVVDLVDERFIAHLPDRGSGQQPPMIQAHLPAHMRRDEAVIARNDFEGNAHPCELGDRTADVRSQRVVKDQQAEQRHFRLVFFSDPRVVAHRTDREAEDPEALSGEGLKLLLDAVVHRTQRDGVPVLNFRVRADRQRLFDRPFGDQQRPRGSRSKDGQPLADEVVGHFVQLAIAGQVPGAVRPQRFVERIDETGLIGRIERGMKEHPFAGTAVDV